MLSERINQIVMDASTLQLKYFRSGNANRKADGSLVTDADIESEKMMKERLKELLPESKFIAEESGTDDGISDAEYIWAIDPIDGTSSFVSGLPVWGISVALLKDRKPYMASLYFPVIDEMYWVDDKGIPLFNGEKLRMLPFNIPLNRDYFVTIMSNAHRRYDIAFKGKTRCLGSTAYHICIVARGVAYAALTGFSRLWDMAGGLTLLERVGGGLFGPDGSKIELAEFLTEKRPNGPYVASTKGRVDSGEFKIKLKR